MIISFSFAAFSALIWSAGVAFLERETPRDSIISALITFACLFAGTYFLIFLLSVTNIDFFPYPAIFWVVFTFSFIGFNVFTEDGKRSAFVYIFSTLSIISVASIFLVIIHHSLVSIIASTGGDLFPVVHFFIIIYCFFRVCLPIHLLLPKLNC